ncbi:class I SAM-dependent methyltransferase [Rhizobium terrae]|uniref:class I SAM-dependent methyltransferase n=1 Tax=Rhizobium terrae TaxID=2171756 RepID=UPI0019675BB1|nr:class I SAM-dependent methyltransferase [Rhizobium terrae]
MDRELTEFAATLADNALVLDAGAGSQKYSGKFLRQRYEAADFEKVDKPYAKSTYVCDLRAIPVEDQRFDAIIFTQVMEHLPEPQMVLAEFNRILKPGGRIFFSAPLCFEEHEKPYDFYRYTQFALRYLFDKAGFEVTDLRWLEGFMGTAAHLLRYLGKCFPRTPAGYGGGVTGAALLIIFQFIALQIRLVSSLARLADIRHRYTCRGMPLNYMAVLVKR